MSSCAIIGGGHVGELLSEYFNKHGQFNNIEKSDFTPPSMSKAVDWIFNLRPLENQDSTDNHKAIINWADSVGCNRLFVAMKQNENDISRLYTNWRATQNNRRLIISYPHLLFGPGMPNFLTDLIKVLRIGRCVMAGLPNKKIYAGYIYGYLDSIDFTLARNDEFIEYEYFEEPVHSLSEIVQTIKRHFSINPSVLYLPRSLLKPVDYSCRQFGINCVISPVSENRSTIRKKLHTFLTASGFNFKYDFDYALTHWETVAPEEMTTPLKSHQHPVSQ